MDAFITFTDYIIVGKPEVMTLSSGSKKVSMAIRSQRPHYKGANGEVAFNKVYLTAFDKVAENIAAFVKEGDCVSFFAEQSCYLDKQQKLRHNYIVQGFSMPPKAKVNSPQDNKQPVNNQHAPAPSTKEEPKQVQPDLRAGLNAMEDFMN